MSPSKRTPSLDWIGLVLEQLAALHPAALAGARPVRPADADADSPAAPDRKGSAQGERQHRAHERQHRPS